MLENIKHINSNNDTIDFNLLGIFINYNDLRDFEWSFKSDDGLITNFTRGVVKKTIPFVFYCTEEQSIYIKNSFFEHFEKDIMNNKPGCFLINGYRYFCYLTKSKKSEYLVTKRYLTLSIEISSDKPFWIKEQTTLLKFYEDEKVDKIKKEYTFTYPYSYQKQKGIANIINDSFTHSDIIIRIFGPCYRPFIKIGTVLYQVICNIDTNEYIEINTESRTIIKILNNGEKTNLFNFRDKTRSDFFIKLPPGASRVSWNGTFSAEIVCIEKRSEPRW